jgi:hypothetical protein
MQNQEFVGENQKIVNIVLAPNKSYPAKIVSEPYLNQYNYPVVLVFDGKNTYEIAIREIEG